MKERLRGQFCNIAAVFYEKKVSVFLPGRNAMFFRSEACRCFLCSSVSFLQKSLHFSLHFFRKMKRKIVRFAIA